MYLAYLTVGPDRQSFRSFSPNFTTPARKKINRIATIRRIILIDFTFNGADVIPET